MPGKFFPDWRTGTAEQCAALRDAAYNLFRHNRYEMAQRIRDETPHWERLNNRYADTERGLTRTQISRHRFKAASKEERDHRRLQRQADQTRPRRAGRITGRRSL